MRAAVERRRVQVPGPILGPERALELMLDVEQSDPDGSSKKRNWKVHQQEWPNADEPYHDGDQSRDRSVRRHGAEPGLAAPAHHADRQPVPQDEQISGTKAEHDNGVPIQAISKPTPSRERQILLHGQRADVTDPASVEIARTRVVDGVRPPPEVVWCQRQYTNDATHPIVRQPMVEEGAMSAIMLDHEESYEEARGGYGEQQTEPVAEVERCPHQDPEQNQRHDRDYNLESATCTARLAVASKNLCPYPRVRDCRSDVSGMLNIFQNRFLSWRNRPS